MNTHYVTRNSSAVSAWICELNRTHGITFERMAQIEPFQGIPAGTLGAIAAGVSIPNIYRRQLGLPKIVKVPETTVYDPVKQSVKNAEPPRHLKRCTIYPTTAPAKIAADLRRVTGQVWTMERNDA